MAAFTAHLVPLDIAYHDELGVFRSVDGVPLFEKHCLAVFHWIYCDIYRFKQK